MISVVIPTYNESENVEDIICSVRDILSSEDYEVLIVDDNSPDGTAEKVERLQDKMENLKLIRRDMKSGIGSAYKKGFSQVEGDIVVQMDADFSHPPEKIPELVSAVENGNDIAVGSRYVKGGDRNDPIWRRINPLIGSYLYRYLLKCPVRDFTSGFKAYNQSAIESLLEEDLPDGFHFQAASLMELTEEGKTVEEVPIDFRPRRAGEPKYSVKDLVNNIKLFLRFFLEKNERPLKFGAVGASGIVVNTGLLYFFTEIIGLYYVLSSIIAVESSIVSNFCFNELWTFIERGKEGLKHLFKRFLKFNAVSLVGMGGNIAILYLLTEFAGIYYLVSNLMAIATVFSWNYLMNTKWTWSK